MYFTEMTIVMAQKISDSRPRTFSGVGIVPCRSSKQVRKAYSGLVPMSPKTTPSAPSASLETGVFADDDRRKAGTAGKTGTGS
jgi:hypothetical protein